MTRVPFSGYFHIDRFLHRPLYGNKIKQNLQHFEKRNEESVQPQQFTTTAYYQDQPFCKLVYSNIQVFADLNKNEMKPNHKKETWPISLTSPTGGIPTTAETIFNLELGNTNMLPKALLPIVLGEYETEMIISTSIPIKKGITSIIDVSKDVFLTNCKFLPTGFSSTSNKRKKYASKGTLFIEGYIEESIEYIPAINLEQSSPKDWLKKINYQIEQKIIINLKILLLQQQVVDSISLKTIQSKE